MSLAAGTKVGPYIVEAPLGAGGIGEVYRARDAQFNRDVALKSCLTSLRAIPTGVPASSAKPRCSPP